eukprot:TRINITY_DN39816_c0_g1_i1.p1 TRINITY_DN39816_c0_g1~~TRINITY_DN39816_c0_g1_i1.p1  ORF type:complete len:508 (-),score=57.89 TRINITY_DN39816_c0_g1_i1:700-2094(-)
MDEETGLQSPRDKQPRHLSGPQPDPQDYPQYQPQLHHPEEPSKEMTTATTKGTGASSILHDVPITEQDILSKNTCKKKGALKKIRKFFCKMRHKGHKGDSDYGKHAGPVEGEQPDPGTHDNMSVMGRRNRVKVFVEFLGGLISRQSQSSEEDIAAQTGSTGLSSLSGGQPKFNVDDIVNACTQIDVVNDITPPIDQRKLLGKGSQGQVYEGYWQGEKVAVKEFTGGLMANLEGNLFKELQRELSIMQQLNHKNIVKCYGVCLKSPHRSLILEHMVNSLHNLIHKHHYRARFSYQDKITIACHIAKALDYMHPSIIHRDIKPSNVLIKGGVAKLADFGITAMPERSHISTTQTRGTIQYAAPELYTEGRINHKADIYSLGVLLWELYSGQRPWDREQEFRVIFRVGSNAERPIIPESCPENYRELIEKCWSQNPTDRPDAIDVLRMLKRERMRLKQISSVESRHS